MTTQKHKEEGRDGGRVGEGGVARRGVEGSPRDFIILRVCLEVVLAFGIFFEPIYVQAE